MGLYFNFSIVFLYLFIVAIYIIKNKLIKNNTIKIKKERLNLLNPKRYFRYFKLFINSKILIVICIFSIISNSITIFQNRKYENLYKDKEEINAVALVVNNGEEKEYNYVYKIKILSSKRYETKNTYLYLKVNKKNDNNLKYGDVININGEFQEPSNKRNFGGFSYKDYLKTIKIYGTIKAKTIEILEENRGNFFISFINKVSNCVEKNVQNILNKKEAGMLMGLLIGDTTNIDKQTEDNFKISSLSHILAVSGMQVTYIISVMYFLFKNGLGKRKTRIIIIISLIFYTILTGFQPSIVRASIMGILVIVADLVYRKSDFLTSIFFSLLIMLIYNPYLITSVGLQLSYLGTIGIVLFYKTIFKILKNIKIKNRKYKYKINKKLILIIGKIKEILAVTISASIAVFPVMLLYFNLFGIYFLITNLLASIIIGPITIFGTVILIISFIYMPLAKILGGALEVFIDFLIYISNFSKLPLAKIYVITPKVFQIVAFYIICIILNYVYKIYNDKNLNITQIRFKNLIALYKYKIKELYNKKIKKYKFKILSVFLVIIIISNVFNSLFLSRNLKIYFVDVGQGDCTFIVTPRNKTILIDGGGSTSSTFDVGENTLIPYILDRGYRKIDLVFISHFDYDHVGGILKVLEEFKVDRVCIPKQEENSENYQKFLKIVKEKNIQVIVVKSGNKVNIENDLFFDILWPIEEQIEENKLNNNAIVMKLNYKNFTMMFTGDIEEEAESSIVNLYKNTNKLKSSVLKVAHHGSKTSTTDEFLELVKPKIALIGVGKDNLFKHPSNKIIEKLENIDIKIYRTDLNGEIEIIINKSGKFNVKPLY